MFDVLVVIAGTLAIRRLAVDVCACVAGMTARSIERPLVSNSRRKGRPTGIAIDHEAVRAARLRRCLTQIDLAEAAGLSARTIASVEAGDPIAPRTARAIASALQLELDRLVVDR